MTWRYILRFFSLAATLLAGVWFYVEGGFEPAITTLAGLAGVISSFIRRGESRQDPEQSADDRPQPRVLHRSEIERALDDLVSFESDSRFQSLSVVLAKQRWPELIASERKWDHGLDAHSLPKTGLACSLTPTINKISEDAERARKSFPQLEELIFFTPAKITNHKALQWAEELKCKVGLRLVVVSREDLITSLMDPANASICESHLGLPQTTLRAIPDHYSAAREACSETIDKWFQQYRLHDHPLIHLNLVRLVGRTNETIPEAIDLSKIQQQLLRGRRLVLEAPPGAGKTTTLLQLAEILAGGDSLCVVVDLPGWIDSDIEILDLVVQFPPFRARAIGAEELARLFSARHVDFLLNGWNEIAEERGRHGAQKLRALERDYPTAGIVLATRSHGLKPPLPGAWRVTLRDLSEGQRMAYLSGALGERAEQLRSQIVANPTLDVLTRTPLMISEVVRLFEASKPIPNTKLGILEAMMQRIEGAAEHSPALSAPPLSGRAPSYLASLALHMTDLGRVDLSEGEARSTVAQESAKLLAGGQLVRAPEPQSIVDALCAHHVLQRLDYPAPSFRFQHQQFQEFYAALGLLERFQELETSPAAELIDSLSRSYLDRPVWEDSLSMIADAVGSSSTIFASHDPITIGERLVALMIAIDPILAAELARRCGDAVWSRVGSRLGRTLRQWYASTDSSHRRCALAAMLATGRDEFIDIMAPLLASSDQQTRLRSYRALGDFHFSSLGSEWRSVVAGWAEEHRCDFVGEVLARRRHAKIAVEFATADPARTVRISALNALTWIGADAEIQGILENLSGPDLLEVVSHGFDVESLPEAARQRLVGELQATADRAEAPLDRIRFGLRLLELNVSTASSALRTDLDALDDSDLRSADDGLLMRAIAALRASDSVWADTWISERISAGRLWADRWLERVEACPPRIVERAISDVGGQELDHPRLEAATLLIAEPANLDMVKRIWLRLIELSGIADEADDRSQLMLTAALRRQLESVLHALPASLRVTAALEVSSVPLSSGQLDAILAVFGQIGEEGDLRESISDQLRFSLLKTLTDAIPSVLERDDFSGSLKASLALALARVGEAESAPKIRTLILADIERRRRGVEAILRREGSARVNGARTSWSSWYTTSLTWLGPEAAEDILIDLLDEPDYSADAAAALAKMALPEQGPRVGLLASTWSSPGGSDEPSAVDEGQRERYAKAISESVERLFEQLEASEEPGQLHGRMKALARTLARLDAHESLALILRAMALPGTWDGWTRADALEELLRHHARIPTDETLAVLDPAIEHTISQGVHNDQNEYLLKRFLRILALVDDSTRGVAQIREILSEVSFGGYRLRELVGALAESDSEEALDLLVELAVSAGNQFQSFAREWIAAVGSMALPEARALLLGLVDPDVTPRVSVPPGLHEMVVEQIVNAAATDSGTRDRILRLCELDVPTGRREILAGTVARLGDLEAVLAGLKLIRDDASPAIPYQLGQAVEAVAVEHRPYGDSGSAYTVVPRSAAALRAKLFDLVLVDASRRHSALSLLGRIEELRLDYGKPPDEPRHPAIQTGHPWPPLDLMSD